MNIYILSLTLYYNINTDNNDDNDNNDDQNVRLTNFQALSPISDLKLGSELCNIV